MRMDISSKAMVMRQLLHLYPHTHVQQNEKQTYLHSDILVRSQFNKSNQYNFTFDPVISLFKLDVSDIS